MSEIPVSDNFDSPTGEFKNYDVTDLDQRTQLKKQKHIDLRSFEQSDLKARIPMAFIDLLGMADLDLKKMSDLNGNTIVRLGEQWTSGIVQKQADRNNWNGLTLSCDVGVTSTQSILRKI